MNLREQRKALLDEAAKLAKAAKDEGREFTDEEVERIDAIKAEVDDLNTKIKKADEAAASIKALADLDPEDQVVTDDADVTAGQPQPKKAKGRFGETFVKCHRFGWN